MENKKGAVWLKIAFIAGAITDAAAILPMLIPGLAKLMWGLTDTRGDFNFAMGMGASLMAGWTLLLIWAFLKPLERRITALLTLVVIAGFVAAEIVAVINGVIPLAVVLPSFIMQFILSALFLTAYIKSGRRASS